MSNPLIVSVVYLLFSTAVFLAFYYISRKISGRHFKTGKFWFFLVSVLIWGAAQYNVSKNGFMFFLTSSTDFFENNYVARWIGFISALLQTACIPSKEQPRRWFSSKEPE